MISLSIPQVCEILGCKRSRVFELLAEGVLERAPRFGRNLRIYADSVELAQARPEPKKRRKQRAPVFEPARREDSRPYDG